MCCSDWFLLLCSDWFLLLWACPKRRPAPLSQLRVFKAWLGPGLGVCVAVALTSEQTAEPVPGKPSLWSLAARVLSRNLVGSGRPGSGRPGLGALLPTVQGRKGGPSILVGKQRDFQHSFQESLHLAVIWPCSAGIKLRWDISRFLGVHSQLVDI